MKMVVKNVRLAFAAGLFEKQPPRDGKGKPKYNCKGILANNHPQLKEIEANMLKVANEKWGVKGAAKLKALATENKTIIHNGDAKPEWDGFPGNLYINCSNTVKPSVKNRQGANAEDGEVYGGCYGNLHIEIWPQDNEHGTRINASLRGFQFVGKGDAFGGGSTPASDEEFEDLGDPDAETVASDDI